MPPLFMYPRPSKFSTSLLVASPPAGLVGRHQHGLAGRGDLAPDIDDGRGFADPPDVHRDRWCVHLVPPFTLWLRWAGQRSAAMRQYRTLVRVLDRDLAVRPLSETTQLYDEVRAGRLEPPPSRAGGEPDHSGPPAPVTWPLVGREVELAALRSAWQAAGRDGRVVAIAGQAGSGKTRLITELREQVAKAGAAVLATRCHDGETALPFVLAADLLRTALAVRPDLPDVLPAQAAAQPDSAAPALDSPVAVTRLYGAIADTLLAAASGVDASAGGHAGRPAGRRGGRVGVVVVEDVHWGGQLVARPDRLPGAAAGRLAAAARPELAARTSRPAARTADRARRGRGPAGRPDHRAGPARRRGHRRAARPGRDAPGRRGQAA